MDVEVFLTTYVEGYLFKDLTSMARITLEAPETAGACGYPMVATALAGVELLGGLLSTEHFNASDIGQGSRHFEEYWNNCLSKCCSTYGQCIGLASLVRSLARNGLAHTFLTKPGIMVTKGDTARHLRIDAEGWLTIDAVRLCEDLQASYFADVKPRLVDPPKRTSMQARLDEMMQQYHRQSQQFFDKLKAGGTLDATIPVPSTNASSIGLIQSYNLTSRSFGPGTVSTTPETPSELRP
ncbi:MAG: hypothetical protein M1370_05195 [Bacteroidetes bacterium]|nr:hypothetical protein [Bacteroidota bacterium]